MSKEHKKPYKKRSSSRPIGTASTSHSLTPRDNRINLSATPNTNRVIVNVKWQPLKKYFETNKNNQKTLICRYASVSEEGNEEPAGSDDSHATVVQSVTEENERSPSTGSGKSKKSDQGNNDNDDNNQEEEEQEEEDAQEEEEVEQGQDEDEGINENNDISTSDTKEDELVVEDIEDEPISPPKPETPEKFKDVPSDPIQDEEEELPPPPPQFTSTTTTVVKSPPQLTPESDKSLTKDVTNTTTTIEIEKLEPISSNKSKSNDMDLKKLTTTNITPTTTSTINAPSTSTATSSKTNNNNDSQIITVPIINEPEMPTKQESPQKIQEKKPLPDISNNR